MEPKNPDAKTCRRFNQRPAASAPAWGHVRDAARSPGMVASRSASWAQGMGSGAASYQAEGDMILPVT